MNNPDVEQFITKMDRWATSYYPKSFDKAFSKLIN